MDGSTLVMIIGLLLAITSASVTPQGQGNANTGHCELVTVDTCMDLGYNSTYLPNFLGQTSQSVASSSLSSLTVLLNMVTEETCQIHLNKLLCSIYVPQCMALKSNGTRGNDINFSPIVSCHAYCTFVMFQCVEGLLQLNPSWTSTDDLIDCSNLPSTNCINPVEINDNNVEYGTTSSAIQEDVTQINPLEEHAEASKEDTNTHGTCQRISIDLCTADIGYNYTIFPNVPGMYAY